MRRDGDAQAEATERSATRSAAPQGATAQAGVISGRVPFRPDLAPPWLDAQLPEGKATMLAPSATLI